MWWIIKVLRKEVSESWIVLASWWTRLSLPPWLFAHTNMLYANSPLTAHSRALMHLSHAHAHTSAVALAVLRSPQFQTAYCRSSSELISYTEPLPPFLLILNEEAIGQCIPEEVVGVPLKDKADIILYLSSRQQIPLKDDTNSVLVKYFMTFPPSLRHLSPSPSVPTEDRNL